VTAVLKNLPFMRIHWKNLLEKEETENREKQQARGFLKAWMVNSWNEKMTALMADVLRHFNALQKEAQRSLIVLPDLLLKRDEVLACLQLMTEKPFPGGCEEKCADAESEEDDNSSIAATRKQAHSLVTKSRRNFEAVRNEVIQTAHNFLEERLNDEQQANISDILKMANAANASELIEAGTRFKLSIFLF
jgi:hypothetical protein